MEKNMKKKPDPPRLLIQAKLAAAVSLRGVVALKQC
jgi:hypothetical protein